MQGLTGLYSCNNCTNSLGIKNTALIVQAKRILEYISMHTRVLLTFDEHLKC